MHIGVDIGGTFTDFVVFDPKSGKVSTFKILSTPKDPSKAMLSGLSKIHGKNNRRVIHGSTVATNALLERKGARTALVTTEGFRDVLQIGRQSRQKLYDLFADPPPPIIPRELRFEIEERVDHKGAVLKKLNKKVLKNLINTLHQEQIESVAVCFLFSFLHPEHEEMVESALNEAGFSSVTRWFQCFSFTSYAAIR